MKPRYPIELLNKRTKSPGFSLVEILVATAIMAGLIAIILGIVNNVLNVWGTAQNRLSANFQSRIALDLMDQDIETATLRSDLGEWFRIEVAPGPTSLPASGGSAVTVAATPVIYLFSAIADELIDSNTSEPYPGDLYAVAYRLHNVNPFGTGNANEEIFGFQRHLVIPQDTFDSALGSDNLGTWWSNEGFALSEAELGAAGSMVAANVVDVTVVFAYIDSSGRQQVVVIDSPNLTGADLGDLQTAYGDDFGSGNVTTASEVSYGPQLFVGPDANPGNAIEDGRPLWVDVKVTILPREASRDIQAIRRGQLTGTTLDELITESGETFSRRIHFKSQPL